MSEGNRLLFVIDKPAQAIPIEATHILNLAPHAVNDSRLVELGDRYQAVLAELRVKYVAFIRAYARNSGLMDRPLEGSSLWWFSEIQHKDSWGDRFFHELVLIKAIEALARDIGIRRVRVYSDSRFLRSHFEGEKGHAGRVIRSLVRRTVLLMRLAWLKLAVRGTLPVRVQHLFFSFFPGNWNRHDGRLSDRFYRRIPELLENAGYALWESGIAPRAPDSSPAVPLHRLVSWRELFAGYIDLRDLFWYWRRRGRLKALSRYEKIDLWPVYRRYLHESILYNGFFYKLLIRSLRRALDRYRPSHLVATGEFGPVAMATSVACAGTTTWSIWYQHSLMATGKLWFLTDPDEIGAVGGVAKDTKVWLGPQHHPLPDSCFVWSNATGAFLAKYAHYPIDRCVVVESGKSSRHRTSMLQRITTPARTILFAPTVDLTEVMEFCRFMEAVCESGLRAPEELVLKLHPGLRGRIDIGRLQSSPWLARVRVAADGSGIETLAREIFCLVSGGTTLGVEAASLGLRVVQYVPTRAMNWSPLDRSNATCFSTVKELLDVLRRPETIVPVQYEEFFALDDPDYSVFIHALHGASGQQPAADSAISVSPAPL